MAAKKNAALTPWMSRCANWWMNGIPNARCGYSEVNSPQNTSCTYTGVPRNIQRYTHDTDLRTGFGDRRITAITTPSAIPSTIAQNVSCKVFQAAVEMRESNRYCR